MTFQEILSDDEFLQEITTKNQDLVNYISQDHVFTQIVDLLVVMPDILDSDYQRCYRYPFIACELFGCNNLDVIKIFYGSKKEVPSPDPDHLSRLFSIVHSQAPIEPLTSGYFCRTVSTLLQFTPREFLTWFFSDPKNVKSIIANH